MIHIDINEELTQVAADLGRQRNLCYVSFSRRLGKRRHFLAGWGKPEYTETHHQALNDQIDLSWQGTMTPTEAATIIRPYMALLEQISSHWITP